MTYSAICHCGKCKVTCYKHGKRAKCAFCNKVRMLGTMIEHGVMKHLCNECCEKKQKELNEKMNKGNQEIGQ